MRKKFSSARHVQRPTTSAAPFLPFLSEADPEQSGEGGLDPLGLVPLADRLAEEIAPGVTARMSRIRFVTAIAVGAVATERLSDVVAADGASTAYLAFEWHVVEALARDRHLPTEATLYVPGISKARSVVARGVHLDAASYLKVPKVFGFYGIYKRLARAMDVVDDQLLLAQRATALCASGKPSKSFLASPIASEGLRAVASSRALRTRYRVPFLQGG